MRNVSVDLWRYLYSLPSAFQNAGRYVLSDERFWEAPASSAHHPTPHQQKGGLALHTLEVIELVHSFSKDDLDLQNKAVLAAIFHDYGKIHEYEFLPDGKIGKTQFASMVGHVVFSWSYFMKCSEEEDSFSPGARQEIGHAILAHHGRREWGSPVTPQTRLAYLLHTADMISSKGVLATEEKELAPGIPSVV